MFAADVITTRCTPAAAMRASGSPASEPPRGEATCSTWSTPLTALSQSSSEVRSATANSSRPSASTPTWVATVSRIACSLPWLRTVVRTR